MSEETNAPSAGADAGASALETADAVNAETAVAEQAAGDVEAEASEDEDESEEQPRRKSGSARLRERLDREMVERARLEERLRLMQEQIAPRQPQAQDFSAPPREEDFNGDFFAFLQAKAVYEAEQRIAPKIEAIQQMLHGRDQEQEQQRVVQSYHERANEFRKIAPDYDDVLADAAETPASPAMIQIIQASEQGPALAYRLAKNPTEAARIASLPPLLAARELGRIEASISQAKPRTESKAPPPLKPISGRGGAQKALSDMSYEEYRKARMGGG